MSQRPIEPKPCYGCNGQGYRLVNRLFRRGRKRWAAPCWTCKGSGIHPQKRVTIPEAS